jgi:hypothetical protein
MSLVEDASNSGLSRAKPTPTDVSGTPLILPNSIPRGPARGVKFLNGTPWRPIFCANCGADGGFVPEENCDFAFYLCQPCAEKHGKIEGTFMVPDEVFWKRVADAQVEKYGRVLTADEQVEALRDSDNLLSKLGRDRHSFPEYRKDRT